MTGWSVCLAGCVCAIGALSTTQGRSDVTPVSDRGGRRLPTRAVKTRGLVDASVLAACFLWWIVVGSSLAGAICALMLAVAGLASHRVVLRGRARSTRRRTEGAVIELCDALGAELRAGLLPGDALRRACAAWPSWFELGRTAELGGDVPSALRRAGESAGASGLVSIAACWEVSAQAGVGLSDVLDRVASGLRAAAEAQAEVAAALAAPRATAVLLGGLPLLGIGLGVAMGADPLSFLFGTPVGLVCLGAGADLSVGGIGWVEALASAAEI